MATSEKIALAPFTNAPEGMCFTYRAVIRAGHVTHIWTLANEKGGIHVSAQISRFSTSEYGEWLGGAETHYAAAPDYMDASKPSHEHCWILGGPCWHDGSSLYFSENIAPMLPPTWEKEPHRMADYHHDRVLSELRYLHRIRFSEEEGEA